MHDEVIVRARVGVATRPVPGSGEARPAVRGLPVLQ